jgi:hypothetical protein
MSRHGYCDDLDQWALIKWRGQVASAIRGSRGQKLISDLIVALEAMPIKQLVAEELQDESGEVCALGAVGKLRGIKITELDQEDPYQVAHAFDIAPQLAREITFVNDDWPSETPAARYQRVLAWAKGNKADPDPGGKR